MNWVRHGSGTTFETGSCYLSCWNKLNLHCSSAIHWSAEKSVTINFYHWKLNFAIDLDHSNSRKLEFFFVSLQSSSYRGSTVKLLFLLSSLLKLLRTEALKIFSHRLPGKNVSQLITLWRLFANIPFRPTSLQKEAKQFSRTRVLFYVSLPS